MRRNRIFRLEITHPFDVFDDDFFNQIQTTSHR